MKEFDVNGTPLSLALFTDVTNSKELLEYMQAGTLEPEVAFLNASLIPDVFPVLAAAYKTLVTKSRGTLTTRTLHSELVYNYSGSKHISESLKRCGISETCTYILVARFGASPDEVEICDQSSGLLLLPAIISSDNSSFSTKFFDISLEAAWELKKMKAVEKLVTGKEIDLEEIEGRANKAQIQKHYKISSLELSISSLSDSITCRIAGRDAL